MKANLALDITPFVVPSTVGVKPFTNLPQQVRNLPSRGEVRTLSSPPEAPQYFTVPLRELEANTLDGLCNDFRKEVFAQADKEQPPGWGMPSFDTRAALEALEVLKEDFETADRSEEKYPILRNALATLDTFLNRLP